jgi:hypothetical protein
MSKQKSVLIEVADVFTFASICAGFVLSATFFALTFVV